jgi:uncharacterized protein (TIGR03067 family)
MHALVFLALIPSAPAPSDIPKELQKLQGIWKMTASERGGVAGPTPPAGFPDRSTLVVVGDAYVFTTHAGTIKIDLEKKTADLTITEGRYKGATLPGLLEISGDTLKLAIQSPSATTRGARGAPTTRERPKELKTEDGTTHILYTFERDAKATKEQAATKLKELKDALPAAPSGFGPAPTTSRATEDMLRQIIERLDRIEKRLDEMEKKQSKPEK